MKSTTIESPSALLLRRFKKNVPAVISAIFLFVVLVIAIAGYLITPDKSANANDQTLALVARKPLTNAVFIQSRDQSIPEPSWINLWIYGDDRPVQNTLVQSAEVIGDSIRYVPYDGGLNVEPIPIKNSNIEYSVVHRKFWLGTDALGRDLMSRLIIGLRVSLAVGLVAVLISILVGTALGMAAGYFRGWVDQLIQWFINVTWSIPSLLLVIAFSLALGKGFWQVFLAVGLTMWVDVARIVRGQVLSLREKEFVEAAKAMGFGPMRILVRHILPNIMGPIIIIGASNFATAILVESGLSFLGIGVQPPVPTLGMMIKEHYPYILMDAAYLALVPGLVIFFLVLAFNLMGNGLSDAFDTKIKLQ
jgi:peptide/nickel transport system permease protein